MWPNPQFPGDLVIFTVEIFNAKHFLSSVISNDQAVFITHMFLQTLKYKKVVLKENLSFIIKSS